MPEKYTIPEGAVMMADRDFRKAEHVEFMKMIGNSNEGHCPAMRRKYKVPLYANQPVRWLADGTPVGDVSDEQLVAALNDAIAKIHARNGWPPPGFRYPDTDGEGHVIEAVGQNGFVKEAP